MSHVRVPTDPPRSHHIYLVHCLFLPTVVFNKIISYYLHTKLLPSFDNDVFSHFMKIVQIFLVRSTSRSKVQKQEIIQQQRIGNTKRYRYNSHCILTIVKHQHEIQFVQHTNMVFNILNVNERV